MKLHVSFKMMLNRAICLMLCSGFLWGERIHLVVKGGGGEAVAEWRARGLKPVEALGGGEWIVVGETTGAGAGVGVPLGLERKLSEELRGGAMPSWAEVNLRGEAGLELLVYFHKDVNADEAQWELDRMGAVLVDRSDYFERLTVKIRREDLGRVAEMDWVRYVAPVFVPVQLESNAASGRLLGVDRLQEEFGLKGRGARVGVVDELVAGHPEFGDRLRLVRPGTAGQHGTHVAGTVAAAGAGNAQLRGMAPEANLVSLPFAGGVGLTSNLGAKVDEQADVGQNSWGGLVSDQLNNCGQFSLYTTLDRDFDQLVEQEKFPIVFSVGNNRSSADCLVQERAGYYSVPPPKSAKNLITVGAVDGGRVLSAFSSAGPTRDGRIKPDVVALGVAVLSTGLNGGMATLSGTSMAAPAVSGLSALLINRFRSKQGRAPQPELLKAIVLNTANDLGNRGPDYQYGFGIPDGGKALRVIDEDQWNTGSVRSGQTEEFEVVLPSGQPALRVMLAWTDPAAPLGRVRQLMNDLDLRLVGPDGAEVRPFRLDGQKPEADAVRGENVLDNVEQAAVEQPLGGKWKIVVSAKELAVGPQAYAITWTTAENPPGPCATVVQPQTVTVPERGGTISVQVTRASTCEPWEAAGAPDWVRLTGAGSNRASGVVKLGMGRNDSGQVREGMLQVAGVGVTVRQNTSCQSRAVKPNEVVNDSLSSNDCLDPGAASGVYYAKVYTFEATAGQRLAVRADSRVVDPYLYVFGPGDQLLGTDDDSGGGLNARVPAWGTLVLPQTGSYRVVVTTAVASQTGAFSLQVTLEAASGSTAALPKVIEACPVEVEGELTENSSRVGRRGDLHATDVYLFEGRIGQTVRMGLTEAAFDGVVYLISPAGALLGMEDDTNGNLPVIERLLPANGVYRLEVTSFGPFEGGRYKLAGTGCSGWQGR